MTTRSMSGQTIFVLIRLSTQVAAESLVLEEEWYEVRDFPRANLNWRSRVATYRVALLMSLKSIFSTEERVCHRFRMGNSSPGDRELQTVSGIHFSWLMHQWCEIEKLQQNSVGPVRAAWIVRAPHCPGLPAPVCTAYWPKSAGTYVSVFESKHSLSTANEFSLKANAFSHFPQVTCFQATSSVHLPVGLLTDRSISNLSNETLSSITLKRFMVCNFGSSTFNSVNFF